MTQTMKGLKQPGRSVVVRGRSGGEAPTERVDRAVSGSVGDGAAHPWTPLVGVLKGDPLGDALNRNIARDRRELDKQADPDER